MSVKRDDTIVFACGALLALVPACLRLDVDSVGPLIVPHAALHTVVVVPFTNLGENAAVPAMVTDALVTELTRRGRIQVKDATRLLGRRSAGNFDRSRVLALARQVGADAALYGVILEGEHYAGAPQRAQTIPAIGVNARLVSVRTGELLWAASLDVSRNQLFVFAGAPLEALAQAVARELGDELEPHLAAGAAYESSAVPATDEARPADLEELALPEAPPAGGSVTTGTTAAGQAGTELGGQPASLPLQQPSALPASEQTPAARVPATQRPGAAPTAAQPPAAQPARRSRPAPSDAKPRPEEPDAGDGSLTRSPGEHSP